ncbi:hypothetical protein Thiosp_03789 [Thiorhodovibrio litoralis]|nr:hypothetical protein Thiosp_03789 [Thiorhodovibrio litoralis]
MSLTRTSAKVFGWVVVPMSALGLTHLVVIARLIFRRCGTLWTPWVFSPF